MIKIAQKRISAQITPDVLQDFQKNILARFSPLISSMKKEYWSRISLPSNEADSWIIQELTGDSASSVFGDLLMTDPDTLLYYMFKKEDSFLEAGIITKGDVENLEPFCEQLLEILEESEIPVDDGWEDVLFNDEVYQTIQEVSHVIKPGSQEIAAAGFLEEELALRFLEKIKSSEATSLYKLVDAKELPRLTPIVDKLEKMGLLTKDFVVICSKTGQPILKVSSRSAIEESSNEANKCFICGNPLSKEIIDEIVSCSDFGRKLVDDNYWFPVRILSALGKYGIPNENVHIQMTDHGIINVFIVLNEQSYLFILCNKKLTIDDAYFVNAYISAFSINHALVICTEKLSAIMQRHIKDSNKDVDISFIDSLGNLDEAIAYYLLEREKDLLTSILEPFTKLTPVKIQELVLMRVAKERPNLTAEIPAARQTIRAAAPPAAISHESQRAPQKQPSAPVFSEAPSSMEESSEQETPSFSEVQPPVSKEPPAHLAQPAFFASSAESALPSQAFAGQVTAHSAQAVHHVSPPPYQSAGAPLAPPPGQGHPSLPTVGQQPPLTPPQVVHHPPQAPPAPQVVHHPPQAPPAPQVVHHPPQAPPAPQVVQHLPQAPPAPQVVQHLPQAPPAPQVVHHPPQAPQGAPPPPQAPPAPQGAPPPQTMQRLQRQPGASYGTPGMTQQAQMPIVPQGYTAQTGGVPPTQPPAPRIVATPPAQASQAPQAPAQHMPPPPQTPQGPPQVMIPTQPPQNEAQPGNSLNVPSDPTDLEDIDDDLFMMEEVYPMDDNSGI